MKNKIIVKWSLIGLIVLVMILVIFNSFQNINSTQNNDKPKIIRNADVVIPTKVSRPGCEKTDSCYFPSKIVITQGNSVTWVNEDAAFHSVTSGFYDKPTKIFDSGYLDPEKSFTLYFDHVGTIDYFCTLHPWMKGQVIVEPN